MPTKHKICFQFQQTGTCTFGERCRFLHQSRNDAGQSSDYLKAFFAQYPYFIYQASNSSSKEFYRLCDESGWEKADERKAEAKAAFQEALVQEFNRRYGTDENELGSWQGLCRAMSLEPPNSLNECREMLRRTHVNLVDLTDRYRTKQKVQIFNSEKELSDYTIENGLWFPREHAKAGGLLRFLLRQIINPSAPVGKRTSRR